MYKVIKMSLFLSMAFCACKMGGCNEFDTIEVADFTINDNAYPNLEDTISKEVYFATDDKTEVRFKSIEKGYWDLNGDGNKDQEDKSETAVKTFVPGLYTVSFWTSDGGKRVNKKIWIQSAQSITPLEPPIEKPLKVNTDKKKDDIDRAAAKEKAARELAEKREADEEAKLVAEEARQKAEDAKRRAADEKKRKEEEIRLKREQEINLAKNLIQESTGLISSDISCIENQKMQVNTGELTLLIKTNLKLKGASVYSATAGKIKLTLVGPKGQKEELVKYVISGRSYLLFSDWSNIVLKPGETWLIQLSGQDGVKLNLGNQCIEPITKDLKAKDDLFLFNLIYNI